MNRVFRNKIVVFFIAVVVIISNTGLPLFHHSVDAKVREKEGNNVIMMVMDGTSAGAISLTRWYKGDDLTLDKILVGGVRTHSAESAITDSAPAATALATGHKSNARVVGLLPKVVNTPGVSPIPPEDTYKPIANVLEGAKLIGKSTGIISTAEIQHATPAGFSAHVPNRKYYQDIAEQQVYQGIDVVLGGGKASLLPGTSRKSRSDGEDLIKVIESKGYEFIETRDELLKSKANKLWGSFASSALAYDFDRKAIRNNEPTLAEMTKKAITTLSKNEKGFFLFIEGSKADWAAHANDTIGIISEVLAFDDAVKEAIDFAEKDGNTLVIVVADHGNGGITMGNHNTTSSYLRIPVSDYINPLKKATMTVVGALSQLKADKSNMKEVAELYGLDDLKDSEVEALKTSKSLRSDMTKMLANRANIGFTTGGHTGEDVFLYAYGPSKPSGLIDNTDIAKIMATYLGVDLEKTTDQLFVNAREEFEKRGYMTRIDFTEQENPVFIAEKQTIKIELPVNKNIAYVTENNDRFTKTLDGVTVYNFKDFFVSKNALSLTQ